MILLDTNVVSELMRNEPAAPVYRWYADHEAKTALPVIVLIELAYGIDRLAAGRRRDVLDRRFKEWRQHYADRIVGFGEAAALRAGAILAAAEGAGRAMSLPDAQIAAIALDAQAVVTTRNIRDFEPSGCELVNPWVS